MQPVRVVAAFLAAAVLAAPAGALTEKQIDKGAKKAARGIRPVVRFLASDKLQGRQNGSEAAGTEKEVVTTCPAPFTPVRTPLSR